MRMPIDTMVVVPDDRDKITLKTDTTDQNKGNCVPNVGSQIIQLPSADTPTNSNAIRATLLDTRSRNAQAARGSAKMPLHGAPRISILF